MGLDTVELVMDVEQHFNVLLPDEDLSKVTTVADVTVLVHSKL